MFQPRDYQLDAVNSIYTYFDHNTGNPIVIAPTGAGKSIIIALFAQKVLQQYCNQRILIVTHVKELVEQNHEKLVSIWPEANAGINAASLNRRETHNNILFCSVQTVFRQPEILGKRDLILIDECHLLNPKGVGMYHKLIQAMLNINPKLKVIGFSATPWRLDSGHLIDQDSLFTDICYEIKIRTLVERGFLAPLIPKPTETLFNTDDLKKSGWDYNKSEMEEIFSESGLLKSACTEIADYFNGRNAGLIFCSGIDHAFKVAAQLRNFKFRVETVTGKTPKAEREYYLDAIKNGRLDFLTNCDVLTTGVDIPNLDLLAILRKTMSSCLWMQILGRGMRLFAGKDNCLVLDFGGNTAEHGPIDTIEAPRRKGETTNEEAAQKRCPHCKAMQHISVRECACGYQFEFNEMPSHMPKADTADILSFQSKPKTERVTQLHLKKWSKKQNTLQVTYFRGIKEIAKEWIAIENPRARMHVVRWWKRFIDPDAIYIPASVDEALDYTGRFINLGEGRDITLKRNGKYLNVVHG